MITQMISVKVHLIIMEIVMFLIILNLLAKIMKIVLIILVMINAKKNLILKQGVKLLINTNINVNQNNFVPGIMLKKIAKTSLIMEEIVIFSMSLQGLVLKKISVLINIAIIPVLKNLFIMIVQNLLIIKLTVIRIETVHIIIAKKSVKKTLQNVLNMII